MSRLGAPFWSFAQREMTKPHKCSKPQLNFIRLDRRYFVYGTYFHVLKREQYLVLEVWARRSSQRAKMIHLWQWDLSDTGRAGDLVPMTFNIGQLLYWTELREALNFKKSSTVNVLQMLLNETRGTVWYPFYWCNYVFQVGFWAPSNLHDKNMI